MNKKILAIQGSEINKINYNTDTSLFLALEAQKRKFDIHQHYFMIQNSLINFVRLELVNVLSIKC